MSRENQVDSPTDQTTPGQAGAAFCPCQDQPKDAASSAQLTEPEAEIPQQSLEAEAFDQESQENILPEYKGFTSPIVHWLNCFFGFCYKLCYRVGAGPAFFPPRHTPSGR